MGTGKMHAGEVHIDAALVGRLIAEQFPRWADLPIRAVRSTGTVNAIYRLGDHLCARLPRGFALHQAALIIPYYGRTNPEFVSLARRTVEEVLADA
jgi:hypothetical protein